MRGKLLLCLFFAAIFSVQQVAAQNHNIIEGSEESGGVTNDHTITELPWEEDFSGVAEFELPEGWEAEEENWYVFDTDNAGGEAPELVFWWEPEKEGRFYLKTPPMDTEEWDDLTLSFKYNIRNFEDPGIYTLSVIAIADGEEYVIEEWVDPDDTGAAEFEGSIDRENHGLGSDDFRLALVFDGSTNNIIGWNIDDIRLSDGPVDTGSESIAEVPDEFRLDQNHPNPFNPSTNIAFQVPENSPVTLEIYDVTGRRITTLVDENLDAGYHEVTFDGTRLASGVYLYRMRAGDFVQTRKLMLIK